MRLKYGNLLEVSPETSLFRPHSRRLIPPRISRRQTHCPYSEPNLSRLSPNPSALAVHLRSNSRDRMLASALNFAIGFFGYPFDGQYRQSILIESTGVRKYS